MVEWRLLRIHLPSQDDAFKSRGLLLPYLALHLDRHLNDRQTPQGQLLNNFISGSVGGFVGTVLNTPYVSRSHHHVDANSFPSSLPVSTSATNFYECAVAVQTHSLHTGCQVSHPGSREATRCCPEIQLDISCVCFFSTKIS